MTYFADFCYMRRN